MLTGQRYGLVKKGGKPQRQPLQRPSVFADDEDDDNEEQDARKRVGREMGKMSARSKAQLDDTLVSALEQDASVFDYDGVYDEMRAAEVDHPLSRPVTQEKQSRYIQNIKQMHKIREREQDRAYERRKLKELAQEEAESGPSTEKFVTSAYKAKLLEDKKWEMEDRRQDAESRSASTLGMQGFYASLLTKNVAMGGDVKEALSAYTVGSSRAHEMFGEEEAPSARNDQQRPSNTRSDVHKRSRSPSEESDRGRRSPEAESERIAKETRAMEQAETAMAPPAARAPSATPTATSTLAPKQSKEELIAAARERALKRKLDKASSSSS